MDGAFHIGTWLVQPSLNAVSRNGTSIHLEPKIMQVLVCLASRAGEPLTKREILETVWQGTFVTDDVLSRSISELRRVFGDDARQAIFIETIPKRGYRLIPAVERFNGLPESPDSPTATVNVAIRTARRRFWLTLGVCVIAGLLALGSLLLAHSNHLRGQLPSDQVPRIRSIAVLPLKNLSDDPAQRYFNYGIAEELITDLSRISGVRVISHTSVNRYEHSDKPLPLIARELGVDAVIEGAVQREGDRVRITTQLIYAPQDSNIWAKTYDTDLGDVLQLQSRLAREIVNEIRVQMTPEEKSRVANQHRVDPEALETYWKGQYHLARFGTGFGKEERYAAMEYFRKATRIDPNFARAYMGLVYVHVPLIAPGPEEASIVRDALRKALAADPNLSEAHLHFALFKEFHDWDFAGAEREFLRAIELEPNNALAHDDYGDYLGNMGRHKEAIEQKQLAQELDPASDHLFDGYLLRGEYRRALEIALSNVALHPNDGAWHNRLYLMYLLTGQHKHTIEEAQRTIALYGHPEMVPPLAATYARYGYESALRLWAKDLEQTLENPLTPAWIAVVYMHIGDNNSAIKWLERGYSERDGYLLTLNSPVWNPLRSDPRFGGLVRRVGLPR